MPKVAVVLYTDWYKVKVLAIDTMKKHAEVKHDFAIMTHYSKLESDSEQYQIINYAHIYILIEFDKARLTIR